MEIITDSVSESLETSEKSIHVKVEDPYTLESTTVNENNSTTQAQFQANETGTEDDVKVDDRESMISQELKQEPTYDEDQSSELDTSIHKEVEMMLDELSNCSSCELSNCSSWESVQVAEPEELPFTRAQLQELIKTPGPSGMSYSQALLRMIRAVTKLARFEKNETLSKADPDMQRIKTLVEDSELEDYIQAQQYYRDLLKKITVKENLEDKETKLEKNTDAKGSAGLSLIQKGDIVINNYKIACRELRLARIILQRAEYAVEKRECSAEFEEKVVWANTTVRRLTPEKMQIMRKKSKKERKNLITDYGKGSELSDEGRYEFSRLMSDPGPKRTGFNIALNLWESAFKRLKEISKSGEQSSSISEEILKERSIIEDKELEEYLKTQINYRKILGFKYVPDFKPASSVLAIIAESKAKSTATKRSIDQTSWESSSHSSQGKEKKRMSIEVLESVSTTGRSRVSDRAQLSRRHEYQRSEASSSRVVERGAPVVITKIRMEEMRDANFFLRKHDDCIRAGRKLSQEDKKNYCWARDILDKYDSIDQESNQGMENRGFKPDQRENQKFQGRQHSNQGRENRGFREDKRGNQQFQGRQGMENRGFIPDQRENQQFQGRQYSNQGMENRGFKPDKRGNQQFQGRQGMENRGFIPDQREDQQYQGLRNQSRRPNSNQNRKLQQEFDHHRGNLNRDSNEQYWGESSRTYVQQRDDRQRQGKVNENSNQSKDNRSYTKEPLKEFIKSESPNGILLPQAVSKRKQATKTMETLINKEQPSESDISIFNLEKKIVDVEELVNFTDMGMNPHNQEVKEECRKATSLPERNIDRQIRNQQPVESIWRDSAQSMGNIECERGLEVIPIPNYKSQERNQQHQNSMSQCGGQDSRQYPVKSEYEPELETYSQDKMRDLSKPSTSIPPKTDQRLVLVDVSKESDGTVPDFSRERIEFEVFSMLESEPPNSMLSVKPGCFEGQRIFDCANQSSVDFFKRIVSELNEEGSQIKAITWEEMCFISSSYGAIVHKTSPKQQPTSDRHCRVFPESQRSQPSDVKVCFIDRNEIDLVISEQNYRRIEKAVLESLFNLMRTNPNAKSPVFGSNELFKGYKVTTCDCLESVEFLKREARSWRELWKGARIEVVSLSEIPSLPKLYVPVQYSQEDGDIGETTLKLLKGQNPGIPMDHWKVQKIGKLGSDSVFVTIAIDVSAVNSLAYHNNKLNLAMSRVKVQVSAYGGYLIDESPGDEERILRELCDNSRF